MDTRLRWRIRVRGYMMSVSSADLRSRFFFSVISLLTAAPIRFTMSFCNSWSFPPPSPALPSPGPRYQSMAG